MGLNTLEKNPNGPLHKKTSPAESGAANSLSVSTLEQTGELLVAVIIGLGISVTVVVVVSRFVPTMRTAVYTPASAITIPVRIGFLAVDKNPPGPYQR